jgi:DNA-binding CsgD family transcriptional regulator
MPADRVIGRESELSRVGEMLDDVARMFSALVLRGEAGAGKTTLWRAGVDEARARSWRVLAASPVEAETGMSFAAIADLFREASDEVLPILPDPQRRALEVALLLADPPESGLDQRAVAAALASALRALCASGPVVVAVDDVQWLDSASAGALSYAARRLRDERVGLLLAARASEAAALPLGLGRALAPERVSSLTVGPLALGAIRALLRRELGLALTRPVLLRIYETAGGNPLYALELGRVQGRGGLEPDRALRLPDSLGELVRERVAALPEMTQQALLLTAASSDRRIAALEAALGEDPRPVLAPAVQAAVVGIRDGNVRFAHPLLAAGAYALASDDECRRIHRRLAEVADDPEEHARHLARSVAGADAAVAAVLDRAAQVALARGAGAAAAELFERARDITPHELAADRQRRAIAAGGALFVAGESARARALLEAAMPEMSAGQMRAEALVVLGRLRRFGGDQPEAAELLRLALAETGLDDRVRSEAAQGLASTLFFMREELPEAHDLAALAVHLARRVDSPELLGEALGMKHHIERVLGHPEASDTLREALEVTAPRPGGRVISAANTHRGLALLWSTGGPEAATVLRGARDAALTSGDEGSLPLLTAALALAEYFAGRWREAATVAHDAREVALDAGQRAWAALAVAVQTLVRASLGDEAPARAAAEEALSLAGERSAAVARIHAQWALGLLELSLGRPDEAVRHLAPERRRLLAAGVGEPGSVRFIADEIEAHLELGELDEAERLIEWLEQRGQALSRGWALACAARYRAMLLIRRGATTDAFAAFERALATHDRVPQPFERARTLLALGPAQRHARQRRDARLTLTEALAAFEALGATLWAQRARSELERISGRAPSPDALTPTERRIVELVAAGQTNPEVAKALVVSPRTVEFHLRNVFRKLDVHSRTELVTHAATANEPPRRTVQQP